MRHALTSLHTNITLTISGRCLHPITYAGVDTRTPYLNGFDVRAVPSGRPSPPTMNWARVALLREVANRCARKDNNTWLIYSDSDAYFQSRHMLRARLKSMPLHIAFVYQSGMWSLNSGFLAFRINFQPPSSAANGTSALPEAISLQLLRRWEESYKPSSDFFAEQRALLRIAKAKTSVSRQTIPGYLGWHIKGYIIYKTNIATLGRSFTAHFGPYLRITVPFTIAALVAIAVLRSSTLDGKVCKKVLRVISFWPLAALLVLLQVMVWKTLRPPESSKQVTKFNLLRILEHLSTVRRSLSQGKMKMPRNVLRLPFSVYIRLLDKAILTKTGLLFLFGAAQTLAWSNIAYISAVLAVVRNIVKLASFVRSRKGHLTSAFDRVSDGKEEEMGV